MKFNSRLRKVVKISWSRVNGNRKRKIAVAFFDKVSVVMEYVVVLITLLTT